jgi:hypothetical protein
MGLECIKGTTVPVVDVVKKAKEVYIINFDSNDRFGMCQCILRVLSRCSAIDSDIWCSGLSNYIPLFCKTVAKARFGANINKAFWWNECDPTKRIEYFDWLIEQYSKEI